VGATVVERHQPDGDEEVYVAMQGSVRFMVGEEQFALGPATAIYVSPDTVREAVALKPDTLVLAVGAKPGEVFESKSWEDLQIVPCAAATAASGQAGRLGLGLAIAKGLLEAQGGEIGVEATDHGCVFTLSGPLSEGTGSMTPC
jgi:hypothetical protein